MENNTIKDDTGGPSKYPISASMENLIQKTFTSSVNIATKNFVGELENYAPEEIRHFLEQTELIGQDGTIKNLSKLTKIVDLSFSGTGGKDYSAIIQALKPEEIKEVIKISTNVFSTEKIDLIKQSDYDDFSNWTELKDGEYEIIKKEGDKRKMSLLRKDPISKKWFIFKYAVKIYSDGVYQYFSSIITSSKENSWKESSIKAIDINLLTFACIEYPMIISFLKENFPKIAEEIEETLKEGNYKVDSGDIHLSVIEEVKNKVEGIQIHPEEEKYSSKTYQKIVENLRNVGIKGPYTQEDLSIGEQMVAGEKMIDNLFKKGADNIVEGEIIDDLTAGLTLNK